MRISLRRALTTLLPVLVVLPVIARADYPANKIDSNQGFSAYYAPAAAESNDLPGAAADQPQAVMISTAANGNSGDCCDCCDDSGTWRDNALLSVGVEAYKSLGDTALPPDTATGFMNSAGLVGSFNTSVGLLEDWPIRGQIGASYGVYDLKGRDTIATNSSEQQTFITAGIYSRSEVLSGDPVSWGLVYDQFWANHWGFLADDVYVGQLRGIAGYALDEYHEVGVWGAFHTTNDPFVAVVGTPLRAMNQYNAYWRYNWEFGGQTMLYVGGHDPNDSGSWLFGVLGQAPLSYNTALYGNVTYAFPGSSSGVVGSNELQWNLGVGLVHSWGGKLVSPTVSGRTGLPLLPVANNGSFLMTN